LLKKSLICLLIAGCTSALAGTMGPVCESTNVTLPCEMNAWEIGGHALYVQPFSTAYSTNNQTYSTTNGITNYSQTGTASTYNWGFQLEAARHFNKGKDLNLNWYHFRGTTNKTFSAYPSSNLSAQAIQQNDSWDHVNLEYGNRINLEENAFIRVHAGFVYARIDTQYINNYGNGTVGNQTNDNINSEFSGFGVRGGMAMHYNLMSNLNIHGDIAAGLLAGTTKSSYWNGTNTVGGTSTLDSYSVGVVSPELDAKAGIEYRYDLTNGHLMFDAGWLWATYLNTMEDNAENSFGIQGLYFGARWIGNVA